MKKLINLNIISWILGIIFYFIFLEYLYKLQLVNAVLILLIAIITFPPSFKLLKNKLNKYFNNSLGNIYRLFILIILFVLFNIINPITTDNKTNFKTAPSKIKTNEIVNTQEEEIKRTSSDIYTVTRIIDGDTIKINDNNKIKTIRLIGIDTPETVQPGKPVQCFGSEASNKLKEVIGGRMVYLKSDQTQDDKDKYSRLLRYVYRDDGLFINKWMIENGYAYEFTYQIPYKYQNEFKTAQNNAKINKLGLWQNGVCDDFNNSPPHNCLIKGNISFTSKEKIFHSPGCDSYKKTIINQNEGEKWFCSEDDAIKAGWRKAKDCP